MEIHGAYDDRFSSVKEEFERNLTARFYEDLVG
jgi:hypothetical protein